ncbi:MAG: ABC transporter ATP-binding protein [Bacillota bacterium]|nr:ABC transporter ATP-binding protein [Bacillota bacterium]
MIRLLAKSIRQYKKQSILSALFVALEVLLEVLIPLVMKDLIDKGIDPGDMQVILRLGLLLLLLALFSLTLGVLSGRSCAIASSGFAANLRQDLYHKVQDFSFSNIDRFSTAGIVTRLTTDVANIQMSYMMLIRVAVRSPVMLLLSLLAAFRINSRLALIFLCALPLLALGLLLIMKYAHPIFRRVFKIYDKLNGLVQENLRGFRVVKSFVREEHEVKKFSQVSSEIHRDFSRAEKIVAFNGPLMQFCMYGCMLLLSWFGARMIVSGDMSTGGLMTLFTYIMQILMSLMMLSMIFIMLTTSRASAERVAELLQEESELKNPPEGKKELADASVCFRQLSFSYQDDPEQLCLQDINLEIPSGSTVGIIGGTGSGKSTLVQLIPRLYDVKEGQLLVGGVDVREYDLESLRNAVGMVLQKNSLFSGSIRENLRWGNPQAGDEEIQQACRAAQAEEFILQLPEGYDSHIEQGGVNLSGGQRQRLCIARALLKKPKILILDDSTSAVDTATDARIRQALKEALPGCSKFIIAQRISSVQDADLILVLEGGRVLAQGKHSQLMENCPLYREIYDSQQKGAPDHAA